MYVHVHTLKQSHDGQRLCDYILAVERLKVGNLIVPFTFSQSVIIYMLYTHTSLPMDLICNL